MARRKRFHADHEEVDQAVRRTRKDKKPRLREILVRRDNARKEILQSADAKKDKVKKIVERKRTTRMVRQNKVTGTTRPKQNQPRHKQTTSFDGSSSPARNFDIR